jgi:glutamate/tyrosine decarboxylase-like PLP-dependent enzyme
LTFCALNEQDGYIVSGGTEANIQAIWIYRNFFMNESSAKREEICIMCCKDSHYSMDKVANLLVLDVFKVEVDESTREISEDEVAKTVRQAKEQGKKYFIVISNMMTTMFGSVDNINAYWNFLNELSCEYRLHIDGAYGGFYYPFSDENSKLSFENPNITSFTLDAHKMAQAPYGTEIFIIRKNYIHHATAKEASYVEGEDLTLIGSRSGANAAATWMILVKNGPYGWQEKIFILQKRTEWMCKQLKQLNVQFYRHPNSNILTIRSKFVHQNIASTFGLVPDDHTNPNWYKIVIMEHVTIEKLSTLVDQMKKSLNVSA